MLLDFYLSAYCTQKPDHLQPPLLEILRLGAYQILYLDRVPDSAAVNTSVELAKISGRGQASGLVNAVLRKIAQNKTTLLPIPERDEAKYLSIRYSHPKWLVKRLLSILGREEAETFLAADNSTPPLTVQVNPLKTDGEGLTAELAGWGVAAKPHPWVPGCLELTGAGDLTTLERLPDRQAAGARPRRPAGVPDRRRAAGAKGAGSLRRPRRQVLQRRLCHGGQGGDRLLRPPRKQAETNSGGCGPAGT